ncbi:DUF881 domain-containing protein [Candidatus Microgenomates bacterium]|nr:DUF881 domain-containing protein [Candidatus Microgenomates bacterium]
MDIYQDINRKIKLALLDRKKRNVFNFDIRKMSKKEIEDSLKKTISSPYLYLILGFLVGALFLIQFKTESTRPLSPLLFYNQLLDLQKEAIADNSELRGQIKKIELEIAEKEEILSGKDGATKNLIANLLEQEAILGLTNVSGSGVEIILGDGSAQIKDEVSKSLTHAADLRDIVNLLWYAGAEAVSINGERIIYNTSIDCIVSTILINTTNYTPPFTIKAIGNKYDLYKLLNSSRKLVDIKKRAAKKQIIFEMVTKDNIKIEKFSGVSSRL